MLEKKSLAAILQWRYRKGGKRMNDTIDKPRWWSHFRRVLNATDTLVCARGYENVLVAAGLLAMNRFKGKVTVCGPKPGKWLFADCDPGPRRRALLVGFDDQFIQQGSMRVLLQTLHLANREVIGILHIGDDTPSGPVATVCKELSIECPEWFLTPCKTFPTLGELLQGVYKELRDGETPRKEGDLIEALFADAAKSVQEASPLAHAMISLHSELFDNALSMVIGDLARNRAKPEGDLACYARLTRLFREAKVVIAKEVLHVNYTTDVLQFSSSDKLDGRGWDTYLREHQLACLIIENTPLEPDEVKASMSESPSRVVQLRERECSASQEAPSFVRLYFNRERFPSSVFGPKLVAALQKGGAKIVGDPKLRWEHQRQTIVLDPRGTSTPEVIKLAQQAISTALAA